METHYYSMPEAVNNVLVLPPTKIAEKIAPLLKLSPEQALQQMRHVAQIKLLNMTAIGDAPAMSIKQPDGRTAHHLSFEVVNEVGDYEALLVPRGIQGGDEANYALGFTNNLTTGDALDGRVSATVARSLHYANGSDTVLVKQLTKEIASLSHLDERIMPKGIVHILESLEGPIDIDDRDFDEDGAEGLNLFLQNCIRTHVDELLALESDITRWPEFLQEDLAKAILSVRNQYVLRASKRQNRIQEWENPSSDEES